MGTSALQVKRSREANVIHGLSRSRIYRTWIAMRRRCLDRAHPQYPFYGGRGIAICERWLDFRNFVADMGIPSEIDTIERIDNDKGYSPDNCRWATKAEQNRNKSSLRYFTINGERRCASEWARIYGVPAYNVLTRLSRGWDIQKALSSMDWRKKYV